MSKQYYVYILASKSHVLYAGVTNDLQRRMEQHKQKVVEGFAQKYNVTRLVYYESTFAVLGKRGDKWRELLFRLDDGRYCANVRTKVVENTLIVDSLACEGGTGVFIADWNRYWIKCQISTCGIVREATIWHNMECCTTRPFSETIKLPSGVHYEGLILHSASEP